MPLNEREQRILEEIERQFYKDDPKLAETVAKTTLESQSRRWNRVAVVGLVLGLVVMLGSFTDYTIVAIGGFILMVVSGGWLAMNLRTGKGEGSGGSVVDSLFDRTRQRWQRDR